MNGDVPKSARKYVVLTWACVLGFVVLTAIGLFTYFGVDQSNDALAGQKVAQDRLDCARRVADTTTRYRDAAEEADRELSRAQGALFIYAIRNPTAPGTVSEAIQQLNDDYDTALHKASETGAALDVRLATPNAERVERQCPSV